MNSLRLREIWRVEGLDNKLLVADCWLLVGTVNGQAYISKARCGAPGVLVFAKA
jgi:hypothetical protein